MIMPYSMYSNLAKIISLEKETTIKKTCISILLSNVLLMSGIGYQTAIAEETEEIDAAQLFESKCGICHSIDRPRSKKKTRQEWDATVTRMKNSNGAPITDSEAALIIEHLAKEYGKEELK